MPGFYFEREVRTENSECYTILEDDQPIGRVDIHFTPGVVHATLCVAESLTRVHIQELVETGGRGVGGRPWRYQGRLHRPCPPGRRHRGLHHSGV